MGFNLKSGNTSAFKMMGSSSPAKKKEEAAPDPRLMRDTPAKMHGPGHDNKETIGTPKMNPPYAKPSGPRERPYPGKGESSGFENFKSNITKPKTKEAMASFRAAQLETKGSDERETKRINP